MPPTPSVSIGVLILIRSALGRLITVGGLAAITGVLGYQGIAEMKTVPGTGNAALSMLLFAGALAVAIAGAMWLLRTKATPDKVAVGLVTALGAGLLVLAGLLNSPGSEQNGAPNYTFFLICLADHCPVRRRLMPTGRSPGRARSSGSAWPWPFWPGLGCWPAACGIRLGCGQMLH